MFHVVKLDTVLRAAMVWMRTVRQGWAALPRRIVISVFRFQVTEEFRAIPFWDGLLILA